MITEDAIVSRVEPNVVWVKARQQSVCGSCKAKSGCGQEVLQRLGGSWSEMPVETGSVSIEQLEPGALVRIGIAENAVLTASLVTYGLPVIGMLMAILLIAPLASSLYSVFAAAAGLYAGGLAAQLWARNLGRSAGYQPVVLSIQPNTPVQPNTLSAEQPIVPS